MLDQPDTIKTRKTTGFLRLTKICERLIQRFFTQCLDEAQLALRSVIKIIAASVLLVLLLFSIWIMLMAIIGFSLYQHHYSLMCIGSLLVLLQLILMGVVAWMIHCFSKGLFFTRLRETVALLK